VLVKAGRAVVRWYPSETQANRATTNGTGVVVFGQQGTLLVHNKKTTLAGGVTGFSLG